MVKFILILLLFSTTAFGQKKILFIGNTSNVCYNLGGMEITTRNSLPDSLTNVDALFIFSSSQSILTEKNIEQVLFFLKSGKGVYLGSENWPLQAESNQITSLLLSKQTWGNFKEENANSASQGILNGKETIQAGTTTVAFPLDYRLKVEAWINDEPLISTGFFLGGKIIIDGGYSRFYCSEIDIEGREILSQFIQFLTN